MVDGRSLQFRYTSIPSRFDGIPMDVSVFRPVLAGDLGTTARLIVNDNSRIWIRMEAAPDRNDKPPA